MYLSKRFKFEAFAGIQLSSLGCESKTNVVNCMFTSLKSNAGEMPENREDALLNKFC